MGYNESRVKKVIFGQSVLKIIGKDNGEERHLPPMPSLPLLTGTDGEKSTIQ